jgi:hypothetical protein
MSLKRVIQGVCSPLASRKVRVAVATVVAAYAAQCGLGCSDDMVLTLMSVGVALILGIAHEDNGRASVQAPANGEKVEG